MSSTPSITFTPLPTPARNVLFTTRDEAFAAAYDLKNSGVIQAAINIRQQTNSEIGAPNPNADGRLPWVIEWTENVVIRDVAYPVKSSLNAGEIYQYVEHYPATVPWRKNLQGDPTAQQVLGSIESGAGFEVDKV